MNYIFQYTKKLVKFKDFLHLCKIVIHIKNYYSINQPAKITLLSNFTLYVEAQA